ncbi:unnamed protein product [Mytilus edulis]|uniref:Endonuclease/exonuclease/phosphatase domain-containing protein n=1 Tax=Mytilus edulis TaxID=6550 RepID=A0A8S3THK5_MYTED|nr:unnamed protein product [Mytilus edulis]
MCDNLSIKKDAQDPEVQKQLINITTQFDLTQFHEEPTRKNILLDLVFTTNPSLMKTSTHIPGISDHAIIITDTDIKPYYSKSNHRKVYTWARANWDEVNKDIDSLTTQIRNNIQNNQNVNEVWLTLKKHLFASLDKSIPSKINQVKQQTTMDNPQDQENAEEKTKPVQPSQKNEILD